MKPLTYRGILCLMTLFGFFQSAIAQNSNVSIGTETIKDRAILWLKAEGNQGLILPVISNRSAFSGLNNTDDKGMLVYDNSDNKVYYWNGSSWVEAGGGAGGSNQTLTINGNTFSLSGSPASTVQLSSSAPTTGQALVWDGTKWVGTTLAGDVTGAASATQVSGLKGQALPTTLPTTANALVYNGTAWAFQPLSSSGEANTASNVGSAGVGVFKQKTGANLEFQKINAASNRIAVSQDAINSEIDIDVNQANLAIASTQITGLGALAALSTIASAQIANGTIIDEDISTTANINITKLAPGSNGQVLTTTGGVPAWANPSGSGTVTNVATGTGLTGGPITGTGTISVAANGITNTLLADNAVTTTKITAGAVDLGKLAGNSVDASKIVDASITGADIQNATITIDKLNASGANANDVLRYNGTAWAASAGAAGTVTSVASGTGLTGGPITSTGTISIAANGVTNALLADNAVTLTKMSVNSVDGSKIVDASITGADIQNATITADKLNASGAAANDVLRYNGTAWVPGTTTSGTVTSVATGSGMTGGPITATGTISIAANGVTNTHLADNAVTNTKIAALAVDLGKMAANSVDASKIVDASVTGADIQNATITVDKLNASGAVANDVLRYNGTAWTTGALSAWGLTGNAGTNPATNFIGTTDNNAFEVRVNNTRVFRYELNPSPTTPGTASPNIIAGYSGNSAAAGVKGSVISGGGLENANTVDGDWATIGGGRDNHAGSMPPNYSAYSTIGGGASNSSTGQWSTIGGGKNNTATGSASAIPGGARLIASSLALTVVGSANVDVAGYEDKTWVLTDPIFIVGNGEIDGTGNVIDRKNALMILKNGRTGVGRTPTANLLEVEGEASKTTASGWAANSDRRIKTDIRDIDNSLDLIKRLRPVKFKYTPEWMTKHPSIKNQYYYNFIAQEYAQVFPESVKSSGETLDGQAEPVLQVDTYNAQITAIKALQVLIQKVEKLEAENAALKIEKVSLESKVSSFEAQQKDILKQIAEIKAMLGTEAVNEIRK